MSIRETKRGTKRAGLALVLLAALSGAGCTGLANGHGLFAYAA